MASSEDKKREIQQLEQQSTEIRAALRELGTPNDNEAPNRLIVVWHGLTANNNGPSDKDCKLQLQLSSPIEEQTLSAINETVTFQDVEANQATLTVTLLDNKNNNDGKELGSSEPLEVQSFLESKQPNVVAVSIANTAVVQLKITFERSKKDMREDLYEQLHATTQKKVQAREEWRQLESSKLTTRTKSTTKPAVAAGFLQKNGAASNQRNATTQKLQQYYQTVSTVVPMAKNYLLFGGFVLLCHMGGHLLVIPAPV